MDQYFVSHHEELRSHGHSGYRGAGPSGGRGIPHLVHGGRERRTRTFVALFDYDPSTTSPNPDTCDEELPFSEGDTIKVYGEKDTDGFYWGECKGRRGYVPNNMVVEVQELSKNTADTSGRGHSRDRWGDIYQNMPVKEMIAMYDYDPQILSPNVDAEVELSFNTGDIILVYGDMDDDGFYMGEIDGERGLVPSNFLAEAPPEYGNGPSRSRQLQDRRGGPGPSGHGPGARGPPPPPRDGRIDQRDRRKDACPVPSQLEYRVDSYHQGQAGPARGRGEGRGDRRGGRGGNWRGPPPGRDQREMVGRPPEEEHRQAQQRHHEEMAATASANPPVKPQTPAKPLKGIPAVVPDFVIPNKESPTAPSGPKFPEAPNLMQKFSEMTGGADTSVDNLISKGKELIFMKFGLGK